MSNYLKILYSGANKYKLPIPTLNQIQMIYKLPNSSKLYMKTRDEYVPFNAKDGSKAPSFAAFDKANPNYSIGYHQTIGNGGTVALHLPLPVIWINPYDPEIVGKNVGPWSSNTNFVEVTSELPQGGPGNWLNVVPGSGMFFNLEGLKILQGRNKLDALLKLATAEEIASKFPNLSWASWNKGTWNDQKDYINSAFGISTLSELVVQVAHNPRNIIPLEWISNCPVVDDWTYQLAKDKGYDVIHFYNTGYNLHWADEFVVISDQDFAQLAKSRILTTKGQCISSNPLMLVCDTEENFFHRVGMSITAKKNLLLIIALGVGACILILILIVYVARRNTKNMKSVRF